MNKSNDQLLTPNTFLLKKSKESQCQGSLPTKTVVQFSPALVNPHQLNQNKKKYSTIIPKFNKDSLYYTPSFMIPYYDNMENPKRKKTYQNMKLDNFNQHIDKLQKLTPKQLGSTQRNTEGSSQNQILQNSQNPIQMKFDPGNQNYCAICSASFHDYWNHVNTTNHRKSIAKNTANQYISELCRKYKLTNDNKIEKIDAYSNKTDVTEKTKTSVAKKRQKYGLQKPPKLSVIKQMNGALNQDTQDKKIPPTYIPIFNNSQQNNVNEYVFEIQESDDVFKQIFQAKKYAHQTDMFDSHKFLCDNYENQAEKKGIWETLINADYSESEINFKKEFIDCQMVLGEI